MAGEAGGWAEAWTALRSGRLDDAERLARAQLLTDPRGHPQVASAEGWFLLGVACHGQGRPAEAEKYFRTALKVRPDAPDVYNGLGLALLGQGRPIEAEECFRRALAMRPDLPEALNNLGRALEKLGRLAQAEPCYRRAVALRPDYINAHYN